MASKKHSHLHRSTGTHKRMDMGQHTFVQTLEAYQADLDTNAAVSPVQKLQRDRQTAVRPFPSTEVNGQGQKNMKKESKK